MSFPGTQTGGARLVRPLLRESGVAWKRRAVQKGLAVREKARKFGKGPPLGRRGAVQNVTRLASNRRCRATWLRVVP